MLTTRMKVPLQAAWIEPSTSLYDAARTSKCEKAQAAMIASRESLRCSQAGLLGLLAPRLAASWKLGRSSIMVRKIIFAAGLALASAARVRAKLSSPIPSYLRSPDSSWSSSNSSSPC